SPTVNAPAPSTPTMNSGSRLWIISEEMSISMLTKPSTQMPGGSAAQRLPPELVMAQAMAATRGERPAAIESRGNDDLRARRSSLARSWGQAVRSTRFVPEHPELHRRLHVEHLHVRLAQSCEQSLSLGLADGRHHLDGLVGKFEEVRGVELAVVAEALRGREPSAAADAQRAGFLQDAFAERLAAVAAVLLGEEGDLVALHGAAVRDFGAGRWWRGPAGSWPASRGR